MLPAIEAILALWNGLSPSTRKAVVETISGAPEALASILSGDAVDLAALPPMPTADELNAEVIARGQNGTAVPNA